MKLLKTIAIWAVVLIGVFVLISWASGQYNQHTDARIACETQLKVRDKKFDMGTKIIAQQAQVGKAGDSSFQRAVRTQMEGRKDGEGVMWKWVQEANPTASVAEVTRLYETLMRSIEVQQNVIAAEEQKLADMKAEDDRLMRKFPGIIFHKIYGTKEFAYNVITSTRAKEAAKTGVDDNIEVFN